MAKLPSLRSSFDDAHDKQVLVDAVFDTVSARYDLGNDLLSLGMHRMWKRRLLALAAIAPDHRVLDIACGTGDITFEAAKLANRGEVVGVDVNPRMMDLAEPKRPAGVTNASFRQCDATALPFADASFDRVLISYAGRGLPDLAKVAAEAFRVLKPGGQFWNLDFARPKVRAVDLAWRGTLASWGAVVGLVVHGDPRTYVYIPASMAHYRGQRWFEGVLRDAGFEVHTIETTLALMAYNQGIKPEITG
jgi:demethylmenaquinone methyltransferase/2-methoxy-6-polyprenyl-1,4-benzoquinol methylase